MGLDPEDTDNWSCSLAKCTVEVPPLTIQERMTLLLFQRCKRKWVFGSDGRRLSLDMLQVQVVAAAMKVEINDDTVRFLEACEDVIVDHDRIVFNE